MNRREFTRTALAGIGGLFFTQKLEGSNHSEDRIRVICVGDDWNPATTEDIMKVMRYVEKHKEIPVSGELLVREFSVNRSPKPGILVVRIGSDNRPAMGDDFESIRDQLDKVLGDPELTIITHHNFELEWVPTQSDPKIPFILASHVKSQFAG